jgi:hypothetical protein
MAVSAPLDSPWDSLRGVLHRLLGFAAAVCACDAPAGLNDRLRPVQPADRVYAPVDALANAMRTQVVVLAGAAGFRPWVLANLTFKPQLSGFLSTAQGVRRVSATHCFICARLAAALGLKP